MTISQKENRGGVRKGAGRKPETEKRTNIDIYLSDKLYLDKVSKELKIPKIKALQAIIAKSKNNLQ